jgi:hypothetical protein
MRPTRDEPTINRRQERLVRTSVSVAPWQIIVIITAEKAAVTKITPAEVGISLPV